MSNFDKESLNALENLCKIKLTDQEIQDFSKSLKRIIDYIETLNEVDTEGVDPCNYVLMDMQKNVFREDEVKPSLSREAFLKNAPDQVAAMLKVPQVIPPTE